MPVVLCSVQQAIVIFSETTATLDTEQAEALPTAIELSANAALSSILIACLIIRFMTVLTKQFLQLSSYDAARLRKFPDFKKAPSDIITLTKFKAKLKSKPLFL